MANSLTCSRCGFIGEEHDFTKSNRTKDGKRGLCKKCKSEADKKYRETHKEQLAEYYHNAWVNDVGGRKQKNKDCKDRRRVGISGSVFDNAVCERCGMTNAEHIEKYGCRLNVHHGQNTGRHNISNGKAPIHTDLHFLCQSCHTTVGNLTHRDYSNYSEALKKAWKTRRKKGSIESA